MGYQAFIHGLSGLSHLSRACVVTIGSFDGVHLGHQHIIACLVALARAQDAPSAVVIFGD